MLSVDALPAYLFPEIHGLSHGIPKKINWVGLKYEIGMKIMTGQFCWVSNLLGMVLLFSGNMRHILNEGGQVHTVKSYMGDIICSTP